MRFLALTVLLAVLAAAQKSSDVNSGIDLTVTSGSTTAYYSYSTNIDNGPASRTVMTIQVSAPSEVSVNTVPSVRPTDDVPNLSAAMSTIENINTNTMAMSNSASASGASDGEPVTITGSPPAATGCTQFTTISGTPSPLCIFENTTAVTTIFSTQASDPATEISPHPASSFPPRSSMTGMSPSMSMPSHPTEMPHSGMMTGPQTMLPPPPSSMEGPMPSLTMWLNSSMTFMTSTRSMPSQMMPSPVSMSRSHSMSHRQSMSHAHSMSMPHGPQSAGGYTMTKNITETLHSTTTIHEPHYSPMPPHHLPKPMTITNVVMTTIVSTVTAEEHTKSHCMEHTITMTKTITKHMSMPHESSQSLIMISQLSDGQINGPPVSVITMTLSPMKPSSLSLHHGPPMVSPSPSAIVDPLQTMPPHGMPHPSMGMPHPSMGMPHPSMGMPHPSMGMPPHAHGTGSTTCTESTGTHNGTLTRSPPVPFPTQPLHSVTLSMEYGKGPKPSHEPTLSAYYSETKAAET